MQPGFRSNDAADGWEESCHLHAQGAWAALIGLISVPAPTWHRKVLDELYVVPQDYETDLMLSALHRQ